MNTSEQNVEQQLQRDRKLGRLVLVVMMLLVIVFTGWVGFIDSKRGDGEQRPLGSEVHRGSDVIAHVSLAGHQHWIQVVCVAGTQYTAYQQLLGSSMIVPFYVDGQVAKCDVSGAPAKQYFFLGTQPGI